MRSVFFGTSEFAVPSLHACAASSDCRLVVTQPDRPAGRGHRVRETPVKAAARELAIPTLEPAQLRDALDALRALEPDIFALASYGKIVPQAILDLPRVGALNVHPSLLPLYRGATPLQTQLRDGVETSGVTIIVMDAGLDTGDIVAQRSTPIGPRETYGEIHDRLALLGAEMLAEAIAAAARGDLPRTPQAARGVPSEAVAATMTRPLRKEDLAIDWDWEARRIVDHVRAFAPAPAARADLCGEPVKILSAYVPDPARVRLTNDAGGGRPGALLGVIDDAALVACGDGAIALARLIPPNRAALDGATFARARSTR